MTYVSQSPDVDSGNIVHIGLKTICGLTEPKRRHRREAGAENTFDDLIKLRARPKVRDRSVTVEQPCDAHTTGRPRELLVPTHGPLPQSEESAGPGMTG